MTDATPEQINFLATIAYKGTPIRSMRNLGTCTQLSLRLPHVPRPETRRQPLACDHRPPRTKRPLLGL
jgi:hypothetical protein